PPYYPDEVRARLWAQRAGGYPMAPPVVCPADLVRSMPNEQGDQQQVSTNQTYRIASPQAGQQVNGLVEIQGTAMFDPAQVQFYKLEIGSGSNPTEWTTLGVTHAEPVSNGKLEELHAYALPPGPYVLRLVLVQNDGNFPPPHTVPITIVE